MVSIKLLILVILISFLFYPEIAEATSKKQHRNIKHKKTTMNGKLKANLKQAPTLRTSQRNGKMNYYSSHMWPTTTTYYRPATTSSFYVRSPSATSTSSHYPMHWSNTYINPSSLMPANTLRRTDDFSSSSPMSTAQSSVMSMQNLNNPVMSMSNSQIPTLYDMSAFTGNVGVMEHPLANSNQNLWSMGETMTATSKPKLNLFNSFNYNDDADMFGGFLNQFLK